MATQVQEALNAEIATRTKEAAALRVTIAALTQRTLVLETANTVTAIDALREELKSSMSRLIVILGNINTGPSSGGSGGGSGGSIGEVLVEIVCANNPNNSARLKSTFNVFVDDVFVDGPFVVESFAGMGVPTSDVFTVKGNWPSGPHDISLIGAGQGLADLFVNAVRFNRAPCYVTGNYTFHPDQAVVNAQSMAIFNGAQAVYFTTYKTPVEAPPPTLPAPQPPAGSVSLPSPLPTILPEALYSGTSVLNTSLSGAGKGKTIIDCTGLRPTFDKAIFVVTVTGLTISNLSLKGAQIAASIGGNAAGVRDNDVGIGFTLDNVEISACQNGILTFASPISVRNSNIHDNGSGSGQTHNIYVGGGPSFTIENTTIQNCNGGHEVKSRSKKTVAKNLTIVTGGNGKCFDVPEGGTVEISLCNLTVKADAGDHGFLSYAMENANNASFGKRVTITDTVFNDPGNLGAFLINGTAIPDAILELVRCTYTGQATPRLLGWGTIIGSIVKGT